jgi:hypothetical protein
VWSIRHGEALLLQTVQLLGHRLLDDGGKIVASNVHQLLELLQLVAQLRSGRELDLVARWGQGFDDRDGS